MLKNKILDIDFLKKNNIRCYNFGLGFIQIVLNDTERVHFYSQDKSLQTNEEIHNHRYNFTSEIIKGVFSNTLYDLSFYQNHINLNNESPELSDDNINWVTPFGTSTPLGARKPLDTDIPTHILTNESCNKDKPVINDISIPVNPIFASWKSYNIGDIYTMNFNQFHTVDWKGNTITYLKRSPIITDYAQVIISKNAEKICPFENKLGEKQIWEIVENIINN